MAMFTEKGQGPLDSEAGLSIIGTGMRVVGDITADGVVKIEGTVVGTVRAGRQVLVTSASRSNPPVSCMVTSWQNGCWCKREARLTASCAWAKARSKRSPSRKRGRSGPTRRARYPHARPSACGLFISIWRSVLPDTVLWESHVTVDNLVR